MLPRTLNRLYIPIGIALVFIVIAVVIVINVQQQRDETAAQIALARITADCIKRTGLDYDYCYRQSYIGLMNDRSRARAVECQNYAPNSDVSFQDCLSVIHSAP